MDWNSTKQQAAHESSTAGLRELTTARYDSTGAQGGDGPGTCVLEELERTDETVGALMGKILELCARLTPVCKPLKDGCGLVGACHPAPAGALITKLREQRDRLHEANGQLAALLGRLEL